MDWQLLTRGSVYERLAEHGHEVIRDEDFAHCYSQRMGRPSIPPSVMMRAVLLGHPRPVFGRGGVAAYAGGS